MQIFCILIISKMQIVNGFVLTENWLALRQIHIKLKKWVVAMIFGCEHFLSFFFFYYFWYGYNYLNTVTFQESQLRKTSFLWMSSLCYSKSWCFNVLLHQIAMYRKLVSLVSRFAETLQSYKQRRSHKTKKIMKHETLEASGRYNYGFVY